jgi:hypothetical protein
MFTYASIPSPSRPARIDLFPSIAMPAAGNRQAETSRTRAFMATFRNIGFSTPVVIGIILIAGFHA